MQRTPFATLEISLTSGPVLLSAGSAARVLTRQLNVVMAIGILYLCYKMDIMSTAASSYLLTTLVVVLVTILVFNSEQLCSRFIAHHIAHHFALWLLIHVF